MLWEPALPANIGKAGSHSDFLDKHIQSVDQAANLFRRGVMHEGSSQNAVLGIDTQGFHQPVGVKMPYSHSQFVISKLRRQFGGTVAIYGKSDRRCTVGDCCLSNQLNFGML